MNGFHDIEQLSAYLDGQLSPSDSARLELRLRSDPQLASAYDDIRSTRGVLRKLPSRRAPRNFTLTRNMVGLKPPLPRSYFTFRLATAFATILFALTVAVNNVLPRLTVQAVMGSGGGGCTSGCGGGPGVVFQAPLSSAAATEAPSATEAPAAEMAPVPTEQQAEPLAPSADTSNAARSTETPATKEPASDSAGQLPDQKQAPLIPVTWQVGFLIASLIGGLGLFLMDRSARRKWR